MRVPRIRLRWRDLKAPAITLALAGALTMGLVATAPAPAQADDSTPQITDMSEQDYNDLGLTVDEEIPKDTEGPYSQDKKTTVVTRNEVYMAANGANGNRYTLRDVLENVERTDLNGGSKLKDSYGNIWGAAKFWQDINDIDHGSDLYKHSDYGGGDWSNLSYNKDETVLANEKSDFSGIHATSTELCLDASTGKDGYVAELRAYGDDQSTTIDGKSIKGKVAIKLFKFDKAGSGSGRKRTEVGELLPTVNSNMTYDGEFKYLRAGYLQELDAVFNITAGDVDGDGVDEIFVYTGCYIDEGGRRKAVMDMFDVGDGNPSSAKHLVLTVDAGPAKSFNIVQDFNEDIHWFQLETCPVVTLATGDLDRDFKDDLAITVSGPFGRSHLSEGSSFCELYTWDQASASLKHVDGFGDSGRIALTSDQGTMLAANATFGTFAARDQNGVKTSSTVTGLVIAGYNHIYEGYFCTNETYPTDVAYRYAYFDVDAGEFKVSNYTLANGKDKGKGALNIARWTYYKSHQDKRYRCTMAPIAVCTANLEGLATPLRNDYILIGGDIYADFACTVGEGANGLGSYVGTLSMSGQHYNASNKHDHKGTDHVWISDVKAGCVSGSYTYRESFIAVVGSHRDEDLTKPDDYYWMTVSHATLLANGTLNTGEEEVITESNRRNTRYGTFISLALPDVDKDSVQIEFEDAYKVYTNPKVLAVLQDAPYYQELEDSFGYLVLGGTGFGQSQGSGAANSGTVSLECGVAAETKTGAPLIVGELSIDVASEKGYEYQKETSVSFSIEYESHAGEGDKAVVYTIPMVYYMYNATNEETGETGVVSAPVALGPETSVVSVDTYDRIAKRCLMTPLSYFLENKSGNPTTYASYYSAGTDTVTQDSFGLGKPGVERAYTGSGFLGSEGEEGASISQEIEVEESEAHTLEIGLGINGSFLSGAKLAKHEFLGGIVFGLSGGYAHEWVSSEGQSFGGTVDNLPKEAKGSYGFQWRLGVNKVDRNDFEDESDTALGTRDTDQFWIVGYDVRDVQQPTAPAVTGFTATSVDSTSVTLSWDAVLPEDSTLSYGISMVRDNSSDPSEGGSAHCDASTTSYTWDGLEPNSRYQFVIAVVDAGINPLGIRSPVVTVSTMPEGMTFSVSGPQAEVVEADATSDSSALRYDPSITAAPGQHVTLTALAQLSRGGEQLSPQYIWYCKTRGASEWEVCGRSTPEIGAPAVLTIEIPTDKSKYEKLQGAQYYCAAVYNNIGFDTGVTTLKINQSTLTTTNRTRPTLKRLAALFGADARSFLDHSQVNTTGPAIEDPAEPSTPAEPTDPGTSDGTDKQAKATASAKKTTAGNLSNTGDRTIAIAAGVAVLGIVAIGAAAFLLRKNRR